jgi:ABC-2 type transport system ATP-binding protein
MQEVEAVSDRVIIIDKGKIVADRKVKETGSSITQIIHLELEKNVAQSDLLEIEGVKHVDEENGVFKLIGEAETDLRKVIAQWAQSNDNLVLSLRHEDESLEEVFRKHTQ